MLRKLINPYALFSCSFAWNNVCFRNDVPAALLGCYGRWGSLERDARAQAINVDGMRCAKGWSVVAAVRSVRPFIEDVDSTAGSGGE